MIPGVEARAARRVGGAKNACFCADPAVSLLPSARGSRELDMCKIWTESVSISKSYGQNKLALVASLKMHQNAGKRCV